MTFRDLEIFAEVCKQMNMSEAARKLFISQSSVSQSISALEKEYGVKLFERLSKKLYLTPQGETLLLYANQHLSDFEQINLQMKSAGNLSFIRVGASTTIGYHLIHSLVDKYEDLYPEVKVKVEIGNSSALEQKVLTSGLDLAIVQGTFLSKDLVYSPALDDELVLVCCPEHPLAGRTVSIQELAQEEFVGREQGSGTQKLLEDVFHAANKSLETRWICSNVDSIKQAVKKKKGIALLSNYLIQDELQREELSIIHLKDHKFYRKFHITTHKDKYKTNYLESFHHLCMETFREMTARE